MITPKHKDERFIACLKPVDILTRDVENIFTALVKKTVGKNDHWSDLQL